MRPTYIYPQCNKIQVHVLIHPKTCTKLIKCYVGKFERDIFSLDTLKKSERLIPIFHILSNSKHNKKSCTIIVYLCPNSYRNRLFSLLFVQCYTRIQFSIRNYLSYFPLRIDFICVFFLLVLYFFFVFSFYISRSNLIILSKYLECIQ